MYCVLHSAQIVVTSTRHLVHMLVMFVIDRGENFQLAVVFVVVHVVFASVVSDPQ